MTRIQKILVAVGVVLAAVTAVAVFRPAQAAPVKAPPPVDRRAAHLVFDADVVRSGETLTFSVHNPTRESFTYGLDAELDRWDGAGWRPAYQVGHGPDGPRLVPAGQDNFVPAVGMIAPVRGVGPAEHVQLTEVPEGWYRMAVTSVIAGSEGPGTPPPTPAHDGAIAYGIFQVV